MDPDQLKGKIYNKSSDIPTSSSLTNCGFLLHANCNTSSKFSSENGIRYDKDNEDCRGTRSTITLNADIDAQYYPCGLIANSMFTDTISALRCIGTGCIQPSTTFSEQGIAWKEDKSLYAKTLWPTTAPFNTQISTKLIPPPRWRKAWPEYANGYNLTNLPDLKQWERFQVWMRKAALPTFRKLWGISDTSLAASLYEVDVTDSNSII